MLKSKIQKSKERCYNYRRTLLDISQKVISVHLGGSFSSFEIMDRASDLCEIKITAAR